VVIEVLANFGEQLSALTDSSNSNLEEKQGDVSDGSFMTKEQTTAEITSLDFDSVFRCTEELRDITGAFRDVVKVEPRRRLGC
jgi:hypothetical protein